MRKITSIIYLFLGLAIFSSCTDMLEQKEETKKKKEDRTFNKSDFETEEDLPPGLSGQSEENQNAINFLKDNEDGIRSILGREVLEFINRGARFGNRQFVWDKFKTIFLIDESFSKHDELERLILKNPKAFGGGCSWLEHSGGTNSYKEELNPCKDVKMAPSFTRYTKKRMNAMKNACEIVVKSNSQMSKIKQTYDGENAHQSIVKILKALFPTMYSNRINLIANALVLETSKKEGNLHKYLVTFLCNDPGWQRP